MINDDLQRYLQQASGRFFATLAQISESPAPRSLLADLKSQAAQMEEWLDAFQAGGNNRWYPLRCYVAACKNFADIAYKWRHIGHFLPRYHLYPDSHRALQTLILQQQLPSYQRVLQIIGQHAQGQAQQLGLPQQSPLPLFPSDLNHVAELGRDRRLRWRPESPLMVKKLASELLQLVKQKPLLVDHGHQQGSALCNEDDLRRIKANLHSLQALYDTHIKHSDQEQKDPALAQLRGHITVLYHLFYIGVEQSHFVERHLLANPGFWQPVLSHHLDGLCHWQPATLGVVEQLLKDSGELCQRLLEQYADQQVIWLDLPRHRGLHMRPAQLISAIVNHYGTPVVMELLGQRYDARRPLSLLRANEALQAQSRRWLAQQLSAAVHCLDREQALGWLVTRKAIRLKQQALPPANQECSLIDQLSELHRQGYLVILDQGQKASFSGDRRALTDLATLARYQWGEDRFGHNLPLPAALAYLNQRF